MAVVARSLHAALGLVEILLNTLGSHSDGEHSVGLLRRHGFGHLAPEIGNLDGVLGCRQAGSN